MDTNLKSSWSEWNLQAKNKKLTSTLQETLDLFFQKKTISQIAKFRGFKEETIQIQIIELITKNLIHIDDVVDIKKKSQIINIIEESKKANNNHFKLSEIKESLDDNITYFEIKCVIAYINSFPKKIDIKNERK